MPNLTNVQVQTQISNTITAIGEDDDITLYQKSLALARLSRAHIQCTRVAVYGIRAATVLKENEVPDLETKLKMPVFKADE